ncbi:Holliday junction DNA helicase RuvA [Spiroplasma clarkii]|nr:Holliday junction DNA helicase RuvA [Spiroplasma clarkii]
MLDIKNLGIKSLLELFDKLSYKELIALCKENELDKICQITGLSLNICKEIVAVTKSKVFDIKYSKKQMLVINSLHKLGYKISDIYKVLALTSERQDPEIIIKEALVKLNEIQS